MTAEYRSGKFKAMFISTVEVKRDSGSLCLPDDESEDAHVADVMVAVWVLGVQYVIRM